jgi:hypothetical protein
MSRYTAEFLYALLPEVYRTRDSERGYPLRDLVTILASQAEVLERDIARLYDNHFIETCEPSLVPYIGGLIGVRALPPLGRNGRAEVANTIGYRRRKGTAAVLEDLARDVTGWPAHAVEFFELLPTTQYMNHLRLHRPRTPDLRNADALDHVNRAFDTAAHTVDVRHIASRRGKHNIPNVGIYLFRIGAFPLQLVVPAAIGDPADARYTFSTLGIDAPLLHNPIAEVGLAHMAEEINVPAPIRRRALHADLEGARGEYYGAGRSLGVFVPDGDSWRLITGVDVVACVLEPMTRALPPNSLAIDPVRGRLAFSNPADRPDVFRVTSYYGFSGAIGGGQYERRSETSGPRSAVVGDPNDPLVQAIRVSLPAGIPFFETITDALVDAQLAWNPGEQRVIEIVDSATYTDAWPPITIPGNGRLVVRAANEQRPTVLLPGDVTVDGGDGSALELNGLLVAGAGVVTTGSLNALDIGHCTFVPGRTLNQDGTTPTPAAVSLTIESATTEASIRASILGAVLSDPQVTLSIADSVLDAHDPASAAYGGANGGSFGGSLTIARSTVVGTIHTTEMTLGENSIFLGVVTAERRQQGCVRFSWVPWRSRVPRRFHCQPVIADGTSDAAADVMQARLSPRFTSLVYGRPGYGQLDWRGPDAITRGAEDGSEMGVFSSLKAPQREAALRIRLDEFLPVALEAGILFAS